MNKHLKLSDFFGRIAANAVLLGPVSMIFFLMAWSLIDPDDHVLANELSVIFLIGSIICTFISIVASGLIYGPLVALAIKVKRSSIGHFKRFLPVLVAISPVSCTAFWLVNIGYDPIPIAIVVSAYLTSVLGWYLLSVSIAKEQRKLKA